MRNLFFAMSAFALFSTASAQTWTEQGDAGMFTANAQFTAGVGTLSQIDGLLTDTDVDLYMITVADIAAFTATMTGTGQEFVQLMLFETNGMGVTLYSTVAGGASNVATITGQFVNSTGLYLLGISYWNNDPRSAIGDIWLSDPWYVEREPDGFGAAGPLVEWELNNSPQFNYSIVLTGTEYAGVPEPGTFVFLAVGLTALAVLRRKH
ncbi:MAG: PEP-CTERM sorting domain-containing protein [Armatimonadota bacterium]|nr:PEP-CTERM sorting domain-containing protein [Armatimonadota bacterium]